MEGCGCARLGWLGGGSARVAQRRLGWCCWRLAVGEARRTGLQGRTQAVSSAGGCGPAGPGGSVAVAGGCDGPRLPLGLFRTVGNWCAARPWLRHCNCVNGVYSVTLLCKCPVRGGKRVFREDCKVVPC